MSYYRKCQKSPPTVSVVDGLKPICPQCFFHYTRLGKCQSDISQMAPADASFAIYAITGLQIRRWRGWCKLLGTTQKILAKSISFRSGVGLCHLQASKRNQIFSESFILIYFFNSSETLACTCASSLEGRFGDEEEKYNECNWLNHNNFGDQRGGCDGDATVPKLRGNSASHCVSTRVKFAKTARPILRKLAVLAQFP